MKGPLLFPTLDGLLVVKALSVMMNDAGHAHPPCLMSAVPYHQNQRCSKSRNKFTN